jgi:hypothetical protein
MERRLEIARTSSDWVLRAPVSEATEMAGLNTHETALMIAFVTWHRHRQI